MVHYSFLAVLYEYLAVHKVSGRANAKIGIN